MAEAWDWQAWLAHLERAGVILGLERMQALLSLLGQPQRGIPVIHVAGTNGKGSVCAVLSAILRLAGYRVGRYTSPHLVDWRERIWVNGQFIGAEDWARLLGQIRDRLDRVDPLGTHPFLTDPGGGEGYPTQFDVTTAAAWLYFQEQQVEVVVLEVGLGGRLDSTNACPETHVAVITSIGMDHWQRLGSTLAAIAGEKAGILKPGIPTVTAPQAPEVMQVLQQVADHHRSPLTVAAPAQFLPDPIPSDSSPQGRDSPGIPRRIQWQGKTYALGLVGPVQGINMGVVLTTVALLRQQGWGIPEAAVVQGLAETTWAGRCQRLVWQGREVWLDGAHNHPGALGLRQFVDQAFPEQSVQWVIGILRSKDARGILAALLRPGDRLGAVGIPGHDSYDPPTLLALAASLQPALAHREVLDPQRLATALPPGRDPVILCGSLYLLGSLLGSLWGKHAEPAA